MAKTRYVVGFAFDHKLEGVLLCQKNRPEWQAGKLNGLGGKIENGESPIEAMIREFKEEAGLDHHGWTYVGMRTMKDVFDLHLFATRIHMSDLAKAAAFETDEPNLLLPVNFNNLHVQGIPGLVWNVAMALECLQTHEPFTFHMEHYRP